MALARLREAAADGRLDELCRRHGVRLLTVFGSAVREDGPEPRDLDVAVKFDADSADLLGFLDQLMELVEFSDVDLMDLARADAVARTSALVDCDPLYESEPYAFTREQLRAMQERMDTQWLRDLEMKRLAG